MLGIIPMYIGLVDLKWTGHHTPYVVFISSYLTEAGHDVTFITEEANPRLDELPNAENLHVRTEQFPTVDYVASDGFVASIREQIARVRQVRQILQTASEEGVDVLHFLYFDRTQLPFYLASKSLKDSMPPVVATLHKDQFTNTEAQFPRSLIFSSIRRSMDSCLKPSKTSYVTVHSANMVDRITETVASADASNTKTVPAPTPALETDVSTEEAREYLNLPVDRPILLCFGALRYDKGPDILANALEEVESAVTVVYAGREDHFTRTDVVEWTNAANSSVEVIDRIKFIPESETDYYFQAADALVLPYRRERGISGPLRRAAMAGTPIIGSADTDIGELIERNKLGLTFEHESPVELQRVIDRFCTDFQPDISDLRRYGESQHWPESGKQFEELYRGVIKN